MVTDKLYLLTYIEADCMKHPERNLAKIQELLQQDLKVQSSSGEKYIPRELLQLHFKAKFSSGQVASTMESI